MYTQREREMLKRVVCSVAKLFVILLCNCIQPVSSQLPADQVSAMTSIYEIIEIDTASSFMWNNVLKTSNPCSWMGVGCSLDNSSINTISFQLFSISTSEFLPFVCNIATLESLDVSYNQLSSVPDGFFTGCGEINGLKLLSFTMNRLNGSLPSFGNGFRVLEKLDFSGNSLSGEISLQLDGLSSLKSLDLGWNEFTGKIPTNLGKMNLLEELLLSSNSFTGEIPVEITKYKNLTWIDLSSNELSGSIPMEFGDFTKLKTLDLSENYLIGAIPSSLSNITTLQTFSAGKNNLNGKMPSDLLSGPRLQNVYLSSNDLEGTIPATNSTTLSYLLLDNNRLTGRLPPVLGNLTNLQVLDLESNDFVGAIPHEISQLNLLELLSIGFNSLNGSIPLWISRMEKLLSLNLQGNKVGGPIPDSFANLSSLTQLKLGNNQLSGQIPDVSRLKSLRVLNLQSNNLSGLIPDSITSLSSLIQLQLGNNQLSGQIPDVSRLKSLRVLNLQSNNLSGLIPDSITSLSSLIQLQLGNNQLSGRIPDMPEGLQIALNLSYNLLVGHIPFSLSTMWGLEVLDLSNNRLSGEIPNLLTNLSSLTHLLLMNNEFSGVVPKFGSRVRVDTSGNKDLIDFREDPIPARKRRSSIDSEVVIAAASGFPVGLLISVVAIFVSRKYNSINGNLSTPNSIHTPNVDFKKGMEAVADPSNITLKTAFSTFYKAVMPSGTTYLVKKINHSHNIFQLFPRHKQLVEEMEVFGSLSNSNVMIPIAYVLTVRRAYLFYEFARGTLHDILHHRMGNKLDWTSRYNIAVGVSKGLAYLHECSSGSVILLDLCSKSILLKSLDEPQISDIELCNLIHHSKIIGRSMFAFAGSDAYVPPEYDGCTNRATAAGNVYSFGVVLLELLTGKPAVSEGTELAKWVLRISDQQNKWDKILDSSVSQTSAAVRTQMFAVLEVALACISSTPEARPNSVTVLQMLLSTRLNN